MEKESTEKTLQERREEEIKLSYGVDGKKEISFLWSDCQHFVGCILDHNNDRKNVYGAGSIHDLDLFLIYWSIDQMLLVSLGTIALERRGGSERIHQPSLVKKGQNLEFSVPVYYRENFFSENGLYENEEKSKQFIVDLQTMKLMA